MFIPATLDDNPYIDRESYIKSLNYLDPVTRAQLLEGNWDIEKGGGVFERHWFKQVDDYPAGMRSVRYWDLAATAATRGKDPSYTCGVLMAMDAGVAWVLDVQRGQWGPADIEKAIVATAKEDQKLVEDGLLLNVDIWMEEERGSAGKNLVNYYSRVLAGHSFRGDYVTGTKVLRAGPHATSAQNGNVRVLRRFWTRAYLDELVGFPELKHKDQVDASSGAFEKVSGSGPITVRGAKRLG